MHVLHVLGAPVLHQRDLADRLGVGQPEPQAFAGAFAAGLHAGLLREHDRDAVAERSVKAADQRLVEAFAVGQQHDHRDDAPGDAEHRQAGAHAIANQADDRLADDFAEQLTAAEA